MQTEININIEPEELKYELREAIKEMAGIELKAMIRDYAKQIVKEEVDKFIEPLVMQFLNEDGFKFTYGGYHDYSKTQNIKSRIKDVVSNYFDEQVYSYSKTSAKMSERYMTCSSGSRSGSPTRIQAYILDTIVDYFDNNFKERIAGELDDIVDNKNKIEEAVKSQLQQLVNAKLK